MSQENVNVVRGLYAAFAKGDVSTVIAALDPQMQWWEAENLLYADGNPYIGPRAVLEGVFRRIGQEWEGYTASPQEVLDAGETIIGYGYYSGTYKRTGKQIRAQFAHFFRFREGKWCTSSNTPIRRSSGKPSQARRAVMPGSCCSGAPAV